MLDLIPLHTNLVPNIFHRMLIYIVDKGRIFTNYIFNFEKYHNILCLSPYICISILSSFSWDLQLSQEKTKTMLKQYLGGQTKSIMVFSEMAYWHTLFENCL